MRFTVSEFVSTKASRWGLLTIIILAILTLIGTGLAGFFSTRHAGHKVLRSRAHDQTRAIKRTMHFMARHESLVLDDLLDSFVDAGLRYIAIVTVKGEVIEEAGERLSPVMKVFSGRFPLIDFHRQVNRVRIVEPLFGRGKNAMRKRFRHHWRDHPWHDHFLVIESEPVLYLTMMQRAKRTLFINSTTSILLILLAYAIWKLSSRAEKVAAQMQRERHLAALGEMSAVLGHELKNPLASLKGHAQLLLEKVTGQPAESNAQTVVDESIRLERLTTQILDFVKTGTLSFLEVNVDEFAKRVIQTVDDQRTQLHNTCQAQHWNIDPDRLEQALTNIIRNAIQSSNGDDPVAVTFENTKQELIIQVRDHGPGLKPGDEMRVFEPFVTDRVKGTGLGLAISKRIVEGHGGTVFAENHGQGGALFTVTIPANHVRR
jgi:two-component system sensor histidine kinase HydH